MPNQYLYYCIYVMKPINNLIMKLRIILLPLLFALFLPALNAQDAPPAFPSEPIQVVEQSEPEAIPTTTMTFEEEMFDFGTVPEGEVVTHVFTFTNTGSEPLIISDAKGSCGCTVPAKPSGPIAPGETASVTVQFNTKNKKGKRNQKVTLTANTVPAQTFIYLIGKVQPDPARDENYEQPEMTFSTEKEPALPKDCFAIYPNPTAEVLKLKMDEDNFGKSTEVAIHSMDGQLMARRRVEAVIGDVEFDVSHYPAGTYYARVSFDGAKPVSQCFVVVE